jgi:hypothetical protein
LFNGRDLSGWTWVSSDPNVPAADVWSVSDEGVLMCTGRPPGYIRTEAEYAEYALRLQWRWAAGDGGNSGVLLHTSEPGAIGIWPKSLEVQLAAGNAGDFWKIGTEVAVENAAARGEGRRYLNLTDGSERPIGEWNQMEIVCRGDEVIVHINGELVNHGTACSAAAGAICLQSEGAEIHFRDIRLTPLAE